jgi:hypothetical protein
VPVFVAYEYFLIARDQSVQPFRTRLIRAAGAATGGAVTATVIYSALNAAVYHVSPFFMVVQQLTVAAKELDRNHVTLMRSGVLRDGFWLTTHFGVLIACLAVLSRCLFLSKAAWRRRATEIFFLAALASSILIAIFLEVTNVAYYLLRDGEYVSFYLPLAYFALTFLLFDSRTTQWRGAILIWLLAMASAILRLVLAKGGGLPFLPHVPMMVLAACLGAALIGARIASRTNLATPACAVFIALTLALPCQFFRDDDVAYTEQAIRAFAGDRTPHIYFNSHDPVGARFLASVTASFTERAWLEHGGAYPNMAVTENPSVTHFHTGDLIVVLSSMIGDIRQIQPTVESYLGPTRQVASLRLERPGFHLWAHMFELVEARDGRQLSARTP